MINYFTNLQFSNNIIFYNNITYLSNILGLITGLIFVFLFTPFFIYSKKAAMKRCKYLYPDETPIYTIRSGAVSRTILIFLIGEFLGTFLLPFFMINNLEAIRQVKYSFLWFWILAFIIGLYGIFFRFNITYVLTNKGLRLISPYKILRCMFKEEFFIKYEDISSTELYQSFFMSKLLIKTKENGYFHGLIGFANLSKVKCIIESYI